MQTRRTFLEHRHKHSQLRLKLKLQVNMKKVTWEVIRQCQVKTQNITYRDITPDILDFQKTRKDKPRRNNRRKKMVIVRTQKYTRQIKDIKRTLTTKRIPKKEGIPRVENRATLKETTVKTQVKDPKTEKKLKLEPLVFFAYTKIQFFNYLNLQLTNNELTTPMVLTHDDIKKENPYD